MRNRRPGLDAGAAHITYLTDRAASSALLIPAISVLAGGHVFGVLGQWLPSFVHPLAFSLFTAAALPAAARPRYLVCVVWFIVNAAFESGQHPQIRGHLGAALQSAFGSTLLT
jgi:hypothetical protein